MTGERLYTIEAIESAVEIATDLDIDVLVKDKSHRAKYTKPRKAMFYFMIRCGYSRKALADHYGVGPGAVYHKREEVTNISDPTIRRIIYDIEQILKDEQGITTNHD